MDEYIRRAAVELHSKSLNEIQVETAKIWTGRACVAADLGLRHDAIEYAHEAVEHAALSGKDSLLRDVRMALKAHGVEV
jgi:hypothetical protein